MLFVAALLHAVVILGVTFGARHDGRTGTLGALDVLLVTDEVAGASHNEHAQYLAQRTQKGAGNIDTSAALTSPSVGASGEAPPGADAPMQRGTPQQAAEVPEAVLVSSVDLADVTYLPPSLTASSRAHDLAGLVVGPQRSGLNDAVELLLKGPADSTHWVAPDTRAARVAPYLATWKRTVERVGSLHFPAAALTHGLGSSPEIEVEIAADGSVVSTRLRQSSGDGALDRSALAVVQLASPFRPFPPELSALYARIRFAYRYQFEAPVAAAP